MFCQPTEPETKDGIWLQTDTEIQPKKIVFDTAFWTADQWMEPSPAADMPSPLHDMGCAQTRDAAYILGGLRYPGFYRHSTIYKYNPVTNTWETRSPMKTSRTVPCCAIVNNVIYTFGGEQDSSTSLDTAEKYIIETNTSSSIAKMISRRSSMGCASVGNKIYLFGGLRQNSSSAESYKTAWAYDITSNTYSSRASSPSDVYSAGCVAVGTDIYIGGLGIYHTDTDTYTEKSLPFSNLGAHQIGDEIYGFNSNGIGYIFNLITETNRNLPLQYTAKYDSCSAFLFDNIYSFGGKSREDRMTSVSTIDCLSLIPKQYQDEPTVIVYYYPKDFTHCTTIFQTKTINHIPVYFKDAMLFQSGEILFPTAYYGDGTAWVKFREGK